MWRTRDGQHDEENFYDGVFCDRCCYGDGRIRIPRICDFQVAAGVFSFDGRDFMVCAGCALFGGDGDSGWQEGGIFAWIKNTLGERFGFAAIFFQWFQVTVCFITMLYFIVSTISSALSAPQIESNSVCHLCAE
jgi:hypothetical protein